MVVEGRKVLAVVEEVVKEREGVVVEVGLVEERVLMVLSMRSESETPSLNCNSLKELSLAFPTDHPGGMCAWSIVRHATQPHSSLYGITTVTSF